MTRCWHDNPSARPSFSDISASIEHIVNAAEHLQLPGHSDIPVQEGAGTRLADQPSPSYSNCTFDNDDDDDAPLYRNCLNTESPEMSTAMLDEHWHVDVNNK